VRVFADGAWREFPGWSCLARRNIPGIGRRWLSLCDTPDLELLPPNFNVRRTAMFRAGLELSILHLGLWLLSVPVRARLLPSLAPLARPLRWLADLFTRFGSDRGGMSVIAEGVDADGTRVHASWRLLAEAGAGPVVPTLPALAVIRSLQKGRLTWRGAAPCTGFLSRAEIESEMARHALSTATEAEMLEQAPLFARALGASFDTLPAAVRFAHAQPVTLVLEGRGSIIGGASMLGRMAARIMRLPPEIDDVPVRVTMAKEGNAELWRRDFDTHTFSTRLSLAPDGMLEERFGPLSMKLALRGGPDGLGMDVLGWRLGPLRLPHFLMPRTDAREGADEAGRFTFDVAIYMPGLGMLAHYRGWLVPAADARPQQSRPEIQV
jgi:hypothetical protein